MAVVIYGSEISRRLKEEMKEEISGYLSQGMRAPQLGVILVGDNPASVSYVRGKKKAAEAVGISLKLIHMPEETAQDELERAITGLNDDPDTDGILIQLPLPKGHGLDENRAVQLVDPGKDVDGLHPVNVGLLHSGLDGFVPCTPIGIMQILKEMGCDPDGKRAVVVGRSKLVGSPVARLLQNANATVTVCHSHTKDLKEICADWRRLLGGMEDGFVKNRLKESGIPQFNADTLENRLYIEMRGGINETADRLFVNTPDNREEIERYLARKTGKHIEVELHMAENRPQGIKTVDIDAMLQQKINMEIEVSDDGEEEEF